MLAYASPAISRIDHEHLHLTLTEKGVIKNAVTYNLIVKVRN